jgi:hypothetical protein
MLWLFDSIEAIRDFMELGGPVLRWIAITIFVMWVVSTMRGKRDRNVGPGMHT